jgi:hypothetical protein
LGRRIRAVVSSAHHDSVDFIQRCKKLFPGLGNAKY